MNNAAESTTSNDTASNRLEIGAARRAVERAQTIVKAYCERGGSEYDRRVAAALQRGLCAFGRGGLAAAEKELASLRRNDAAEAIIWNLQNFCHQLVLAE